MITLLHTLKKNLYIKLTYPALVTQQGDDGVMMQDLMRDHVHPVVDQEVCVHFLVMIKNQWIM